MYARPSPMISSARGCSKAPPASSGQPLLAGAAPPASSISTWTARSTVSWMQDVAQRAAVAAPTISTRRGWRVGQQRDVDQRLVVQELVSLGGLEGVVEDERPPERTVSMISTCWNCERPSTKMRPSWNRCWKPLRATSAKERLRPWRSWVMVRLRHRRAPASSP